ncbi:hypothetical protein MNBD_GAMMA07-2085 [hydrothermal vent metagenome]|uniref:Flagellar hook-length control protein-like C-terminal domain-containing protein n=1 Tax=hydrothermal vent metagenome TaxID=652676 RepID=A0A3B0WM30_9ZZZZ
MELQQIISQNVSNIERQSSNNNALFSNTQSALNNNDKSSFKEQLNDEIKQVENKKESKKIKENQQDRGDKEQYMETDGKLKKDLKKETKIVENTDNSNPEDKPGTNKNSNQQESPLEENVVVLDRVSNDMPGENRPLLTGTELPLANTLTQLLNPVSPESIVLTDDIVSTPNIEPQSAVSLEISRQQTVDIVQQKITNSIRENTPAILTDSQNAKPFNAPLNLNVNLADKVQIQDTGFNKLMSEMPSTEVITQTTRLQQVPLITAASNGVVTAQNIAVNPLLEAGSVSTTAISGKVLSSAIAVNVQNQNWSQQMMQQVSYMVKGGVQQAEIKLNPANLGPMEIKLALQDDQASVQFVTQHAVVRDALDSAIPKLKEMLEQQGLNLSDVDVSTQSEQQGREQNDSNAKIDTNTLSENSDDIELSQESMIKADVSSGVSIFA